MHRTPSFTSRVPSALCHYEIKRVPIGMPVKVTDYLLCFNADPEKKFGPEMFQSTDVKSDVTRKDCLEFIHS